MMNHEQVMRQALEALEADNSKLWPSEKRTTAITALRAALAEPVQEPVAWLSTDCIGERDLCFSPPLDNDQVLPLYAAPPQRKSLTEEQKLDLVTNWFSEDWAIKNALGLLDDYDTVRAREIGDQR